MKSSRLSFNPAVAKGVFRRCWPLWAAYLGFLLLTFPFPLLRYVQTSADRESLSAFRTGCMQQIYASGVFQALAGFVVGLLAAAVLFGYLYNSRGSTLMNSLPVRRESLFLTLYLTGLVPMLLGQFLVTGLTMLMTAGSNIEAACFLKWLLCAALGLIAFYGFAVFCAMLTGNLIILPAVYVVLNLAAVAYEASIGRCLDVLVYGLSRSGSRFEFLSPVVAIADSLRVGGEGPYQVRLEGLGVLGAYAAAGAVFAVLALLLYRGRRMESVSDFVAIPVLKPIFRFCMGFGGASVFAAVAYSNLFEGILSGAKAAWSMALLLVIGAFLGWLIAEMLIRRSVRAFPLPWKGLCVVCAICLLTVFAAENDITGYERRVPDPDQVESVSFSYDSRFTEPENIRALTELHREMIGKKALYDTADSENGVWTSADADYGAWSRETEFSVQTDRNQIVKLWMPLHYTMKNGSELQRMYILPFRASEVDDADSTVGKALALLNSQEGVRSRMTPDLPMKEEYVNYAVINRETSDGYDDSYRLSPKEAVELWNRAMLPDAEKGNLCLYTIADTEENLKTQTSLRIEINLYDQAQSTAPYYWYHSFRVFTFSENCLDWIGTHTDLEWETMDRVNADRLASYQG